jgi:parallel beta-helix repeat protein
MRFLATVAALLAMAAGAAAATLKVPSEQYPTIQSAANDANFGDTIKIAPGVYNESVIIAAKSNIRFLGSRGTIWESHVEGYTICLTISGNGYVVQGIKFRNAYRGVYLEGSGNTVTKCTFVNTWEGSIDSYGDDFTCVKNSFLGCYRGVYAGEGGMNVVIEKNTFRRVYDRHVLVEGDGAVVRNNLSWDYHAEGDAIAVNGASPEIAGNKVRSAYGNGIAAYGDGAEILGNTVGYGYTGIHLSGTSGTIEGNRVNTTYSYGIDVSGGYNQVVGNEAAFSNSAAIHLVGDFNVASDNKCHDVTYDRGIHAVGSGTIIEGNTTWSTFASGINAIGSNITVRGNRVSNSFGGRGIFVSGGDNHTIEDNQVSDCAEGGIGVIGSNGPISGNTVSGTATYFFSGISLSGDGHVLAGNQVTGAGHSGIYINGSGNDLVDCVVTGAAVNGFIVNAGSDNTVDGCTATGCDGQGFLNGATNTTVTNSTFLKNALDVANTGTLANGTTGMTFDTGGEAQAPIHQSYP